MNTIFYPETLPSKTSTLLGSLKEVGPDFLQTFYLSGVTALSLQLGHRESEDLDFFSQANFDPRQIQIELEKVGRLESAELLQNTLNCELAGVKLQFLGYPYPLLLPLVEYDGIRLSSILDIACTKLQTIGTRGSKKDFVDLYFIFEKYPLPDLLDFMKKKYLRSDYSVTHILKSLIYFEDAEGQPMPRLHKDIAWSEIQSKMGEVVKSIRLSI